MSLIYLDNAATSYPKPESVYRKTIEIMRHTGGSPGRGSHRMSLEASRVLFETRELISELFNIESSDRIVFTKNATEAINIALKGILSKGDHIITTDVEHNSVVNSVATLQREGIAVTVVKADKDGVISPSVIDAASRKETRLVCLTHASNVFGGIVKLRDIGDICHRNGVMFMVDASQTAGAVEIDVDIMQIDLLAATGHKALFGPQGVGFLYLREGIEPVPLIDGGTGEGGISLEIPERLESGTMNTPAIGGLGQGIRFLLSEGVDSIRRYEEQLMGTLVSGIMRIKGVSIIGTEDPEKRVSLISFNIEGKDPSSVGYLLDTEFGIMVRSGLHCAPKAHRTAGTYPGGAVRVSPCFFTTEREIDKFIEAVGLIAGLNSG